MSAPKIASCATNTQSTDTSSIEKPEPNADSNEVMTIDELKNEEDDLQQELKEWLAIQSDKIKVKLWWDKLHKLALKLKNPEEEERLRRKIETYLETAPSMFSDVDDDKVEFRRQLPNYIIKKLKKMYLKPAKCDVGSCRKETPMYYSRYIVQFLKKSVMRWLKGISLKKMVYKDDLEKIVERDDIFNHIVDKLEPVVLVRPKFDSRYKEALNCTITDIVNDLPIVIDSQNKEQYLKQITTALVDDILNIDAKIPITYIQPTVAEIKRFVKEQITFCLDKTHTNISTRRIQSLETELADQLLDLIDVKDVDSCIDNVKKMFKDIAKMPEHKAKYYTNIIITDYKEFFFRENYFNVKQHIKAQPNICREFLKKSNPMYISDTTNEEEYKIRLVEVINKWFTNINKHIKDKSCKDIVVKYIGNDIVDRFKYLHENPQSKCTELEELEYIKDLIFKRINNVGEQYNTITLDHTRELLKLIKQIPTPLSLNILNISSDSQPQKSKDEPLIKNIVSEIYDWFDKLPIDVQSLGDTNLNKTVINNSVKEIEKIISNKELTDVDKELDDWATKVFNGNLSETYVKELKDKIKSSSYTTCEDNDLENDPRQEKSIVRNYEDIIEEWIDTIPLVSTKKGSHINLRNEIVHDLAKTMYEIKFKQHSGQNINEKLRVEISSFMKKLPLDPQIGKYSDRNEYAMKLITKIESYLGEGATEITSKESENQSVTERLESAILDWLTKLHLSNSQRKINESHVLVIKQLAMNLQKAIHGGGSVYEIIREHLNKLDIYQDMQFLPNAAIQLKEYLYKMGFFKDLRLQDHDEEDILVANADTSAKKAPIQIAEYGDFEMQNDQFFKILQQFKTLGANDDKVLEEIVKLMQSLPKTNSHKQNEEYLEEKAHSLLQSLKGSIESKDKPPNKHAIIKIVGDAIRNWAQLLPIEPEYNPRELKKVIEEMTTVITTLLNHPNYNLLHKQDQEIKEEVIKYLKKIPLSHEPKQRVTKVACKQAKNLKDKHTDNIDSGNINRRDVAVYGVSVKNTSDEFSIQSIKADDIDSGLSAYTKQVVNQITDWLKGLNLQINQDEGFISVVINDLASDIVDRHKYLELNPQSRKSPKDELEQLKFQIFKWVNKLVGDENANTIAHADDLMKKIQSMPAPMITKPKDSSVNARNNTMTKKDGNVPRHDPATSAGSVIDAASSSSKQLSSPGRQTTPNSPKIQRSEQQNSKEAIFEKYQKIFKEKIYELPIDTPTPESAQLAQLARTGIYNGIIKMIFRLKTDPELQNDYGYTELILEDRLDEMLDILPQTDEMKRCRHGWKLSIMSNAMDMLKELQGITDRASFKQRLKDGFNRKFARNFELEQCFLLQQGFLAEMADAYILETKYNEQDPIKANIYRQRLMKKIDELANHLTKQHNLEFRYLKKPLLVQQAMKVLDSVPVPQDDILDEEVAEILLAEEIGKWYQELPITPYINEFDEVFRKRMIEMLSKKLCDIEKNEDDLDTSKERQMKHEVSKFLVERGRLAQGEDLNINFMVDELNNRIKNMKLKDMSYGVFEKNKPVSSTFAEIGNVDILAPLIEEPKTPHVSADSQVGPIYQEIVQNHFPSNIYPGSNLGTVQGQSYRVPAQPGLHESQDRAELNAKQIDRSLTFTTMPPRIFPPKTNLESSQFGPMHEYSNRQFIRRRDVSRPGPPPNTPHIEQGLMAQGVSQVRFSPNQAQSPRQVEPGDFQPRTSTQRMISRSSSPRAYSNEFNQRTHPARLSTGPHQSNLEASQLGLSNEYIRQHTQSPISSPRSSPRRRWPVIDHETDRDYVPEVRQAPYEKSASNVRVCRNFPGDLGVPCPAYDEDTEDEGRERIFIKCRCRERYRRRRRICLDSLPCPEFRSPCRHYFI